MSRYGLVMSIVATRDLVAGEEIFVSYNYALEKAPEWYQVSHPSYIKLTILTYFNKYLFCIQSLQAIWFAHLREDQGLSEQEIYEWCVR